jgi:hypothetical protein
MLPRALVHGRLSQGSHAARAPVPPPDRGLSRCDTASSPTSPSQPGAVPALLRNHRQDRAALTLLRSVEARSGAGARGAASNARRRSVNVSKRLPALARLEGPRPCLRLGPFYVCVPVGRADRSGSTADHLLLEDEKDFWVETTLIVVQGGGWAVRISTRVANPIEVEGIAPSMPGLELLVVRCTIPVVCSGRSLSRGHGTDSDDRRHKPNHNSPCPLHYHLNSSSVSPN